MGRRAAATDRRGAGDRARTRVLVDQVTERGIAALDAGRILAAGRAQLDARYFDGRFQTMNWGALKQSAAIEIDRARRLRAVLEGSIAPGALRLLEDDIRFLLAAIRDVDRDVEATIEGARPLAGDALDWLLDRERIVVEAVSLLVLVNEAMDTGIRQGVALALRTVPFALLERRARLLAEALVELERALDAAKRATSAAWRRGLLNSAITGALLAQPHVGLVARGGLFVGQGLANWVLGAHDVGSHSVHAAERFAEGIGDLDAASRRVRTFARESGKVFTVVGYRFDVDDILEGYDRIEEVRRAMERATDRLERLQDDLGRAAPVIDLLRAAWARWESDLAGGGTDVVVSRDSLTDLRRRHAYHP